MLLTVSLSVSDALGATRSVVVDPEDSSIQYPLDFFSANSELVVDAIPWDQVHGGGTTAQRPSCTSANDGFLYANSTTGTIEICDGGTWQTWVDLSDGFEDAPTDGKFYGRRNGVWESPTTFQGRGIEGGILQAPLSHANRSLQGFFKYKSSGAGGTSDEHWKIATLQETIGSQGNTLYVRLIGGRYNSASKGIVEVMISNRESERFWYWLRGTKPDQTGIRVFREADGKLSVYAFLAGGANNFNGFAVDAVMGNWENPGAFFSEVYANPTNTGASPTGTLVFDSRTATPDWHIPYQAVPQVMGTNVALVGHTHAASDITSGIMATARLGSGTASTNTFLRGDSTWATIPSTSANLADGNYGDVTVSGNGTTITINSNSVALGTDTTGNYVATIAGTANQVTVSGSGSENASVTIGLANTIDLGGKTSFEIPNSASPVTDAFGEIAGDNNAWATGRGAVQFYDGTSNTYLLGIQSSVTPSNGQMPYYTNGVWLLRNPPTGGGGSVGVSLTNVLSVWAGVTFVYDEEEDIEGTVLYGNMQSAQWFSGYPGPLNVDLTFADIGHTNYIVVLGHVAGQINHAASIVWGTKETDSCRVMISAVAQNFAQHGDVFDLWIVEQKASGTVQGEFSPDSLSVSDFTARNWTMASFRALDGSQPPTGYASFSTRNGIPVWTFDPSTQEAIDFIGIVPTAANLANGVVVRLHTTSAATSGNMRWGVQFDRLTGDIDTDTFDTAAEVTEATSSTSGVPTVVEIVTSNLDGLTAGDAYRLRVYRDTTDNADTINSNDLELFAVEIRTR